MKEAPEHILSYRNLLLIAFTEGAAVMVLELIGGRMVAPVYGSSLVVWTTVLGITMAGLALGYFAGGNMAMRQDPVKRLTLLLLGASFLILIMPKLATFSLSHLSSDSLFFSVFVSSLVFLFLPVTLLGATTPILVRLFSDLGVPQGKASGRVYGSSTIGGICFTFLVGFWLVPSFGLSATAFWTAIGLSLFPVIFLMRSGGWKYGLILIILLGLGTALDFSKQRAEGLKVIHQSEGLLGQLLVVDQPKDNGEQGMDRIMFLNRMGQTWIDKRSGNSMWSYPNFVTVLASSLKEKPDVLILGIGGGTLGNLLINTLQARVDAVELDERIGKIARQNFGLHPDVKLYVDDARHFIRTCDKKYDLIVFDVFKGEVPPAHVLTVECFRDAGKNLSKDGFMIINFNGFINGEEGKAGRAVIRTIQAAGYELQMFPTLGTEDYRNMLYVASPGKKSFEKTRIMLNVYNKEVKIDTMQLSLDAIPFSKEDKPLTDDRPVLELLNMEAAKVWRQEYNNNYTKKYSEKGIPVFR